MTTGLYYNKLTGTVYKTVKFTTAGLAKVTTEAGSQYLVERINLKKVRKDTPDAR